MKHLWIAIALLTGCNLGGNTPPKFQTINGEEVKYLFGFAYVPSTIFSPLVVQPNSQWNISLEVSDANGDDVEILFPEAPGQINFNQETKQGYWNIPDDIVDNYPTLQILAVDDKGASDILIYPLEIAQEWDSGMWDTGMWDTGDWRNDRILDGSDLVGEFSIDENDNRIQGTMEFLAPNRRCKITWAETKGSSLNPCELCTHSWSITIERGSVESTQPYCLEQQQQLESVVWNVGWSDRVEWNGLVYNSPLLYEHSTAGWVPFGQATVQQGHFSFQMDLDTYLID